MTNTSHKIVVITGGFGYVGYEVATKLAKEQWKVVIIYNGTNATLVQEKLQFLPGAFAYKCNLKDLPKVEQILTLIEKEVGPIYLGVHAASHKPLRKKLIDTTSKDLEDQIEGTFTISFNFLTACGKLLKRRGEGVLIGITTAAVVYDEAAKFLSAYIPAKFGVQGMLTMLQAELSPVRVYSLAPGFMHGGMNADIPWAFVEMMKRKNGKELADGKKVAEAIVSIVNTPEKYTSLTIPLAPEYEK